eukprot:3726831-Ditylum_brightwellii.AAC.1
MIESGCLPLDGKFVQFAVAPWPDTDLLYAFGAGLWYWRRRRRRRLQCEAEGSGGKLGVDGDIALVVIPEMICDNEEIQEEETLAEGKTSV